MKSDYVLIGSVLLLATGLELIFGYTYGSVLFSAAYPVSGASVQVFLNPTDLRQWLGPADAAWTPATHRRPYQRNREEISDSERAAKGTLIREPCDDALTSVTACRRDLSLRHSPDLRSVFQSCWHFITDERNCR